MITVAKLRKTSKPQGFILYQGPSLIDGKPIVVIATGFKTSSDNPKTGHCVQTWILPANQSPVKSWTSGKDCSICGDCKHSSPKNGGWNTCYVNVYQAPHNVWFAWKKGRYVVPNNLTINHFRNKIVRIGSYGDPSAVPVNVWEMVSTYAKGFVGYTHQWHRAFIDEDLKHYCMASCDTEKEMLRAQAKGWRTFRVRLENETLFSNEIQCPASLEAGQKMTCEQCGLCSGIKANKDSRKSIAIVVHGRKWRCQRFAKIMQRRKNKKSYRDLIGV